MEQDVSFECPYCWERISVRVDLSAGGQTYVQDCEVCCNPIELSFQVRGGRLQNFDAAAIQ